MMNRKRVLKASLILTLLLTVSSVFSQSEMMKEDTKMVGGAAMYPSKNIVENAMNSKDHTTLVAAVKAAELVEVLMGAGPFTVFAPTNAAFDELPEGTVTNLVKPENKTVLQSILKYHVLSGKYSAKKIQLLIEKNEGKAKISTVNGGALTAWLKDGAIYVSDENGNSAMVTISDVNQSNGVIHVIDTVLLPKS